ncbi:hypothetical protein ACIRLA_36275 [Streptomyces sp. NPDC102364]|uniref:hypothetical protein n=1 Tax=Streptomyces sp. NPDC102364 TaxID=3366161 RepID=UPI00380D8EEF
MWIYVAADRFRDSELVRAEEVVRLRQEEAGCQVVFADVRGSSREVRVADPVMTIGEPDLPPNFTLGLAQALHNAKTSAEKDGESIVVTARLINGQSWEWVVHRLDQALESWRTDAVINGR